MIVLSILYGLNKIDIIKVLSILIAFLVIDILTNIFFKNYFSHPSLVECFFSYNQVERIELSRADSQSSVLRISIGDALYINYVEKAKRCYMIQGLENLVPTKFNYNSFVGTETILFWKN